MGIYLAVKPTPLSCLDLSKMQKAIHLKSPIVKDKLHCTLMYSADAEGKGYAPNPDIVYDAEVVGCEIMGTKESGWQALVLKLKCPALHRRFNLAQSRGLKHSYPDFLPHVSLAYEKDNGDLEGYLVELREYLLTQPQIKIELSQEYMEPLKG